MTGVAQVEIILAAAAIGGKNTNYQGAVRPPPPVKSNHLGPIAHWEMLVESLPYGIEAEESDLCDECKQTETVKHFLPDCRSWTVERK